MVVWVRARSAAAVVDASRKGTHVGTGRAHGGREGLLIDPLSPLHAEGFDRPIPGCPTAIAAEGSPSMQPLLEAFGPGEGWVVAAGRGYLKLSPRHACGRMSARMPLPFASGFDQISGVRGARSRAVFRGRRVVHFTIRTETQAATHTPLWRESYRPNPWLGRLFPDPAKLGAEGDTAPQRGSVDRAGSSRRSTGSTSTHSW